VDIRLHRSDNETEAQRAPTVRGIPELPGMLLDHSATLRGFSMLFLGWKSEKEEFS